MTRIHHQAVSANEETTTTDTSTDDSTAAETLMEAGYDDWGGIEWLVVHCAACGTEIDGAPAVPAHENIMGGCWYDAWVDLVRARRITFECPDCGTRLMAGKMPPTYLASEDRHHTRDHTHAAL